jgi:peptidyl-prolyl isomerase D
MENLLVSLCYLVSISRLDHVLSAVRQIENYPTYNGDVSKDPIIIADCGQLNPEDPSLTQAPVSVDGDEYEDYPDDEDRDVQKPEIALEAAKSIRELANKLYKEGKLELALKKYQSKGHLLVHFVVYERIAEALTCTRSWMVKMQR